ncbi:ScbR family autoregulator-binding transcription factor [Streptomyces sp. NBC_01092]|uniref:ScbR family autoregulator-binding transcription factor n=1 Tax=Streptomyces sp. NBC_01092 TaxID=2903748 RepID=UPI0038636439|nr:TetR/AcrR family transcriptional regulator [Streptomyces sp. NBC_01092]
MTKQERAARTRDALLLAAAREFRLHGYDRAKLSVISAEAGVSSGALHFHFENKAALAQALRTEASHSLRRAARLVHSRRTSALQALVDVSHALADLLRRSIVVRAGFVLGCETEHGTGLNLRQEWQCCVQQLLAEADDERTLAQGVLQQHMAGALVASTVGYEVLSRSNPEWLSCFTLTAFWELLLPTLAAPPALTHLDPAGSDAAHRASAAALRTGCVPASVGPAAP